MTNINKPVRVWSSDRKLRYGIVAETWLQLQQKVECKFGLLGKKFTVVLEEDGTIVDEIFWETVEAHKRLIILKDGESWRGPPTTLPNIFQYSKGLSTMPGGGDTTDAAAGDGDGPAHHTIHMFIELQNNPAALALLNVDNLELIKDIDLDDILNNEGSYGLDKEFCKRIQDMSIELYVKRRTEADAMEYINLLKEQSIESNLK